MMSRRKRRRVSKGCQKGGFFVPNFAKNVGKIAVATGLLRYKKKKKGPKGGLSLWGKIKKDMDNVLG